MKRNPLNKRILRDLMKNIGRYIAIALMMIATIVMLSGMLASSDVARKSLDDSRIDNNMEDGNFQTAFKIEDDKLNKIQNNDIKIYENFYQDFDVVKKNGKDELDDTLIRLYEKRQSVDIESIFDGKLPENDDEVALDRLFLSKNDINVGDKISIGDKDYKVVGSISMPDYSGLFKKNTDIIMDAFHFGVGVLNSDGFNALNENKCIYNYSYDITKQDLDSDEITDKNNDLKDTITSNGIMLTGFLACDNNQCITFVDDDMGTDLPLIKSFSYVIILIMAFVFSIVIISTIDEESQIIGTFLALGYSKWEIIAHYIKMPIMVSIFSAIVGNLCGYTIMAKAFLSMYYDNYSLPPSGAITINKEAAILTTVIPIIIMVLVNIIVLRYKMTLTPLKFLRKDLKKSSKKSGIKLPNFKFINRFRIRIILQNKANYFMLFIGIILGSIIFLFGICVNPTIEKYLSDIKDTSFSDYQYILKEPVELDAEKFIIQSMEIENSQTNKKMDVSLYGINMDSKYVEDLDLTPNDTDSIYLSEGLLSKFDKKVSDKITLIDKSTGKEHEFTIKGTIKYSAGLAAFMNDKALKNRFSYDKEYYNGYLSDNELNIDDDKLLTKITIDDLTSVGKQMLSAFNTASYVMFVVAVVVFLSLMYILTKIVIDKNAINISYLKVFGYNNKEVNSLYLRATTIVVIIASIIALPICYYLLAWIFVECLSKVSGYIELYLAWYHYVIMFVTALASYFVVNTLHIKRVKRIKMSDALKGRE